MSTPRILDGYEQVLLTRPIGTTVSIMDNQQLVHDLTALTEPHSLPTPPDIPEILARVDEQVKSGKVTDARLKHFLTNRSYVKALAHLREASDGSAD